MSRIDRDARRFREIGETHRQDLQEFIKHGHLGQRIQIPIKIVDLPEFVYDQKDKGGVGQGDAEEGDPVDAEPDDGDEEGDPGEDAGEHEYYEMDPEEFARELDEELGLNFEEKGQKVVETSEGAFNETRRAGPNSTLDVDHLFKQGMKRLMTMYSDDEYLKEMLRVDGYGVERVWQWARQNSINTSKGQIQDLESEIPADERTKYASPEEIERTLNRHPPRAAFKNMQFRRDDERYRAPETIEEPQHNAVVINIRDVSGSMRENKRELVERVFTPLDWYLQGKYDNVEFVYIAHDAEAWEVERDDFFGIRSGGGTKVSSAYQLLHEEILSQYPWSEWNRFVFAAGDGENQSQDTEENLIPFMRETNATRQAYLEVQPDKSGGRYGRASTVSEDLNDEFEDTDDIRTTVVEGKDDILDSITHILDTVDTDNNATN